MFLAIAVDNLATAQELTAEQEEAEALAKEQKEKSAAKEATMFLPNSLMGPVPSLTVTETETKDAKAANVNNTSTKSAPNNAKTNSKYS